MILRRIVFQRVTLLAFYTFFQISTHALADSVPSDLTVSQAELSAEDREILKAGEMGAGRYLAGGVLGIVPGLGIGHAVHGRYWEKGWIFTVGELVAAGFAYSETRRCVENIFDFSRSAEGRNKDLCNANVISGATYVFAAFKTWEILDIWITPQLRNKRYRELTVNPASSASMKFFLLPGFNQALAGLQISY